MPVVEVEIKHIKDINGNTMKKINNKHRFPKLLVLGNMRHGKDTFGEILRDHMSLSFQSSSQAAADIFIYDELKGRYGYETPEECFEDRINHRAEWFDLITAYNSEDRSRLAKSILEINDCYIGMRNRKEVEGCIAEGIFDLIVWVDASERLPLEDSDSFDIDKSCADFIVENNGTLEEFTNKVLRIGKLLKYKKIPEVIPMSVGG